MKLGNLSGRSPKNLVNYRVMDEQDKGCCPQLCRGMAAQHILYPRKIRR
ncbi:MAG: hypothetical protein Q4E89_05335 [Eubacteriales bacterium]|nr:hypothetical protein [Eubacteriales bacterium]